jgi:uncharacterized protein DUF4349
MNGPEAPRDTVLEQIEAALRADSAEPRPAFARELDRRVREGFPKPRRRARVALPRRWAPALAGAAVLLVAAFVAIGVVQQDSGTTDHTAALQKQPAAEPPALREFDAAGGAATLAPPNAASATGARHVERDVRLTLAAPQDKLQRAADGIGTVAEDHNGFVQSSRVTTGDAGSSGGSFELRVPQRELEATIADLSKLGDLRSRSENGQDVTGPYNSVQRRLGNALVERRTLKLRMRHASGPKADAIRAQIARLHSVIDTLNSRMDDLRRRTVYSKVSVDLELAKDSSGGTGAAFDDASRILEGMLNFTVRALAVILPLGLVAALAALGTRILRRRRREAALM